MVMDAEVPDLLHDWLGRGGGILLSFTVCVLLITDMAGLPKGSFPRKVNTPRECELD